MSEYQYYDFRRIDKPLTKSERESVAELSSRAHVTGHKATFVYNYGDFHGSVSQLMLDTFDIMLYVANWGTQRLVFRLPKTLINIKALKDYFVSDEISYQQQGNYLTLDLHFNDDEGGGDWIEGEDLLDDMLALREELIQGDYRVLYLAWLKAAEKVEHLDEEIREPVVPAGLNNLSVAQKEYANFIELDEILIETAAKNSPKRETYPDPVTHLSLLNTDEKDDFLQRLCANEIGLSATLNRRLKSLHNASTPKNKQNKNNTKHRIFSDIYETYEDDFEQEKIAEKKRIDTEIERRIKEEARVYKQKIDTLHGQEDKLWHTIYGLVQQSLAKNYEMAVEHIVDLQYLARREAEEDAFNQKLREFSMEYSRRTALIRRLNEKGLVN